MEGNNSIPKRIIILVRIEDSLYQSIIKKVKNLKEKKGGSRKSINRVDELNKVEFRKRQPLNSVKRELKLWKIKHWQKTYTK